MNNPPPCPPCDPTSGEKQIDFDAPKFPLDEIQPRLTPDEVVDVENSFQIVKRKATKKL